MTNEEKLRETFPNTIFIFRKNGNNETAAIMVSDEWLQGDYDQMYKDSAHCDRLKLDGMLEDAYEHGYQQARYDYEVQPCEDAIDRQALRAQFNHLDEVYEGMSEEEEHEAYIYGQIIRAIDSAPPVTPKQKWIPVDYDRYPETYPKAFQEVWITDANDQVHHIAYNGTRNIKAWMPYVRPEPYKEGESE